MAGNRITWDIGYYDPDTHYVYRSDAPMDPNSLPTPIATLGQGISVYEDTNSIVENNTYYYRVDAEKMGLTIPGYEIEYFATSNTINFHDVFGDGSIVATYQFNGDATDLGGTYNGTLGSTSTFTTGIDSSQAVVTDGTDSGSVTGLFNNADQNHSYSIWIATNSQFDYGVMSFNTFIFNSSGNEIEVFDDSSGKGSTVKYSIPLSEYPRDSTFFHLVISLSNNVPTIYINGVDIGTSQTGTNSRSNTLGGGGLGKLFVASYYYAATYDQLRIFNRPLIQSDVDILYQEGTQ